MNKKKMLEIIRLTDKVCKEHKECDRDNVLHAIMCLNQTPLKRLEMSVRRANLSVYAKRN